MRDANFCFEIFISNYCYMYHIETLSILHKCNITLYKRNVTFTFCLKHFRLSYCKITNMTTRVQKKVTNIASKGVVFFLTDVAK